MSTKQTFGKIPKDQNYFEFIAMSRSHLKMAKTSLAHVRDFQYKDPTSAMDFGTMGHMAILEPERFEETYEPVVLEDGQKYDRRTKATKEAIREIEQSGLTPISPDDWAMLRAIRAELSNPSSVAAKTASRILYETDGQNELPIFWTDPNTKLKCKAKIDRAIFGKKISVVDVKIVRDASYQGFQQQCKDYALDIQDVLYSRGAEIYFKEKGLPVQFVFILIEKLEKVSPTKYGPVRVGIYQVNDGQRSLVNQWVDMTMGQIKDCYLRQIEAQKAAKEGKEYDGVVWPEYERNTKHGIVSAELPGYYAHRYYQDLGIEN